MEQAADDSTPPPHRGGRQSVRTNKFTPGVIPASKWSDTNKFKVGDKIVAKWTDDLFYPAEILSIARGRYAVRFVEDGVVSRDLEAADLAFPAEIG
eukprot:CAMPEP_0119264642 /NCGR_PEP_ID=MMETSP1329-20130426/3670_1 /TAXON_ID=114041 /ORGANISM="Genus nov. species nov., Strain RCC1024" /LENGTH=95 /DNA_ID=CAMNT_0007264425 /DNA_START=199 /DNA_END=482 /DNA_ORIENTATION=-